jgi:hypothetical protein
MKRGLAVGFVEGSRTKSLYGLAITMVDCMVNQLIGRRDVSGLWGSTCPLMFQYTTMLYRTACSTKAFVSSA